MVLYEKLTGRKFEPILGDVKSRILDNLKLEEVCK